MPSAQHLKRGITANWDRCEDKIGDRCKLKIRDRCELNFTNVPEIPNDLLDKSGVYVILCFLGDKYFVIDVGESATVKTRVENHERENCWTKNCTGTLMAAVFYTPQTQQQGRMEIEQKIRQKYNPPCGER